MRHAASSGSSRPTKAETWLLETLCPHNSSVIAATLRVETPCTDHLHQRGDQRLLAALVAGEEFGRERPVPVLRHPELKRPHARGQRAWSGAVAIPGAPLAALVPPRPEMGGHLLLQDRLHRPLHDPAQEARIVQQDRLCQAAPVGTIALGHRHSRRDSGANTPLSWRTVATPVTRSSPPLLQNYRDTT